MQDFNDDEIFFVTYNDVVKSPSIEMLKMIIQKYHKNYEGFIDFSIINKFSSIDDLYKFILERKDINFLKDISLPGFDYTKGYELLYKKNNNLFEDGMELSFGSSLRILVLQKFLKKIYFWTDTYDKRVHRDIFKIYSTGDKINYVVGDFNSTLKKIGEITGFVLNDIKLVNNIIDSKAYEKVPILIGNYNFNKEDKTDKLKIGYEYILEKNKSIVYLFNPIKN